MKSAKEQVLDFYQSAGILNKNYCLDVLHEDVKLEWYSSKGHLVLELNDILALSKDLRLSYFDLRTDVYDILHEDNKVMIRYAYYVRTFENSDEELLLAHFFTSWELKDNKFYRGVQMSQL